MTYAAMILRDEKILRRWTGVIGSHCHCSFAEIQATMLACREIPDGSDVVIYTDIPTAAKCYGLNPAWSGRPMSQLRTAIHQLREETRRFGSVEIEIVNQREWCYQWCHINSRKAASHAKGATRRLKKDILNERIARHKAAIRNGKGVPYPIAVEKPQRLRYSIGPILQMAIEGSESP
jgi:hypothetical protein